EAREDERVSRYLHTRNALAHQRPSQRTASRFDLGQLGHGPRFPYHRIVDDAALRNSALAASRALPGWPQIRGPQGGVAGDLSVRVGVDRESHVEAQRETAAGVDVETEACSSAQERLLLLLHILRTADDVKAIAVPV